MFRGIFHGIPNNCISSILPVNWQDVLFLSSKVYRIKRGKVADAFSQTTGCYILFNRELTLLGQGESASNLWSITNPSRLLIVNRPIQGYRRHFVGGANTMGRAHGGPALIDSNDCSCYIFATFMRIFVFKRL